MSTDSAGYQHTDAYLGAGVAYSASHGVWGWHSAEKCVRLEKKKRKKEGLFLNLGAGVEAALAVRALDSPRSVISYKPARAKEAALSVTLRDYAHHRLVRRWQRSAGGLCPSPVLVKPTTTTAEKKKNK